MKKNIILLLLATFFIFPVYSQLKSPAASPKSKIYQEVGLVEIRIDYSRPSKKGREIFGGLVPLNKIWRTGANSPTTIFFSEDVKVNNKLIKGGEYYIYSVPSKSKLDLVIYEKTDAWGSLPSFDESLIKARLKSDFIKLNNNVETFTISISNISNNGASLNIMWDNKLAVYYIDVMTRKKMLDSITETISNNPSLSDYRKAAIYYFEENIDINKAVKWIDIAFKDSDDLKYWQLRYKALIYEKAGRLDKAVNYAKTGYEKAKLNNAVDGISSLENIYNRLKNN